MCVVMVNVACQYTWDKETSTIQELFHELDLSVYMCDVFLINDWLTRAQLTVCGATIGHAVLVCMNKLAKREQGKHVSKGYSFGSLCFKYLPRVPALALGGIPACQLAALFY